MPDAPRPETALRIMAVHAHPDDESSKGAATMARYVAEGHDVLVVTCTGGERGDVLNHRLVDDPEVVADLPGVRRREMAAAVAELGVRHAWLGFVDSGFPEAAERGEGEPAPPLPAGCFADLPLDQVTRPLTRLVLEHRPHVLLTYDENGGYPHPDHVRTHEVSMAAVAAAADDLADPWQVPKVYYHHGFPRERIVALHEAALAAGMSSPFADWLEGWDDDPAARARVTTRVPCAEWFDVRERALRAHATQIDPDQWFAVPTDVVRRIWPTEEFELVRSAVPTELPEADLLAGLRGVTLAADGSVLDLAVGS